MKKIVVLGAGHGGLVAAIKLSQAGYDITIVEKSEREKISFNWEDDIRFDIFKIVGLENPSEEIYSQKLKWKFIAPDEKNFLRVTQLAPMEEVSISRRGLATFLISQAELAGAKIVFSEIAKTLNLKDGFVTGVSCQSGNNYECDMVIDASGLRSPFRAQIPDQFLVQKEPEKDDLMQACRAFYKGMDGVARPDPDNALTLLHLDFPGIAWCNYNHLDEVDVLIGRMGSLSAEEAENAIENLRFSNPILSYQELRPAVFTEIGVRHPLSVPVADGYAAVGDSAFQSMPLMGSGIEASMKAGMFLAEQIISIKDKPLSAANLWPYQVKFMQEIGASYTFIDVLKRWAINIPSKQVNWVFASGAITESDLSMISTEKDPSGKPGSIGIVKKAILLLKNPRLIGLAAGCLFRASHAKSIASKIPDSYDISKISKWKDKYEGCIDHK